MDMIKILLPLLVICGLILYIIFTFKKNAKNEHKENINQSESASTEDTQGEVTYMNLGMSIGVCFGVAYGIIFDNFAIGISLGMLFGMAIGVSIKQE